MPIQRRFTGYRLRLVGRHFSDYAQELQDLLKSLWNQANGIPGGWLNTVAKRIQAGVAATAGTLNAGWAAADHVHDIETATPGATGKTASEGTGTALLRASAVIRQGIVTTKGDLLSHDGTTAERTPPAPGADYLLISTAAAPTGMKWVEGPTEDELLIIHQRMQAEADGEELTDDRYVSRYGRHRSGRSLR